MPKPQTPLQSLVLLLAAATLSSIPSNIKIQYLSLGIGCTFHLNCLRDEVTMTTDILVRARAECVRDHHDLSEKWRQFLQVKLSASKIQSRLLKAAGMEWVLYLQEMWAIAESLDKSEHELREIQKSALLAIEAQCQRKLAGEITQSVATGTGTETSDKDT
ncbi:hypothetical protein DFH07DRAFT_956339 [Mycena maculata]|uniref:Uncharacterized protein n=1 Tax=Mycena maculata TaxID=230809 RepID=A0AAD7JGS3_9AGAR|nr:hypothetical protein DFH07DRAFT_956339 [Mycena maculata]